MGEERRAARGVEDWVFAVILAVVGPILFMAVEASAQGTRNSPRVPIRLLVDRDRDGTASAADGALPASTPALVLPNLDDDTGRCSGVAAPCNDSLDRKVNGAEDRKDLAPMVLEPITNPSPALTGRIEIRPTKKIRLFVLEGDHTTYLDPVRSTLNAARLAKGVNFLLEGLDVLRDVKSWDGNIRVTVKIYDGKTLIGSDEAMLRIAPVLFHSNLDRATLIMSTLLSGGAESGLFVQKLVAASRTFSSRLSDIAAEQGVPDGYTAVRGTVADNAQWTQDLFEPGYASFPGAGGRPHSMRLLLKAASQEPIFTQNNNATTLAKRGEGASIASYIKGFRPRPRTMIVDTQLRGPNVGVIEVRERFDPSRMTPKDAEVQAVADTLNSSGNIDTLPPYVAPDGRSFPYGRILYGNGGNLKIDRRMALFLESQQQPPLILDTGWLSVKHVDETISVVPAPSSPRGWRVMLADPDRGWRALNDLARKGLGGTKLFVGKGFDKDADGTESAATMTVDEILSDTDLKRANSIASAAIAKQRATLVQEVGLFEGDFIRVPVLFTFSDDGYEFDKVEALSPGISNGLWVNGTTFVAPDPFGPTFEGSDLFKSLTERLLGPLGTAVTWIDQWDYLHRWKGEVHCGTNAFREFRFTQWWAKRPA